MFLGWGNWQVEEGPLVLSLLWLLLRSSLASQTQATPSLQIKPGSPGSQLQHLPPWPPCWHTHQWLSYLLPPPPRPSLSGHSPFLPTSVPSDP